MDGQGRPGIPGQEMSGPVEMGNDRGDLPPFDAAAWTSRATRLINITDGLEPLIELLTARQDWLGLGERELRSQELLRRFAATLRSRAPLYELTAALIAPYLAAIPRDNASARPDEAIIRANLVTLMEHLFAVPDPSGFDAWKQLAEWLWSHQTAWAHADLQRRLGMERVSTLNPEEYDRAFAGQLAGADRDAVRERAAQQFLTYAQELAKVVVDTLDPGAATPDRLAGLLALAPVSDPAALIPPTRLGEPVSANPPLIDGHLEVFNSSHYQALRTAFYKREAFARVPDSPWPTAHLRVGTISAQAELRPPAADGAALLAPEQVDLWSAVMFRHSQELSDLDADVLDGLSATWLSQARTPQDRAVGDVDQLLAMRGLQPRLREDGRRVGYYPQQRREILRALGHIQNMLVTIAEVEVDSEVAGRGPTGEPRTLRFESRAFVLTDRVSMVDPDGELDLHRFIFRPGELFARFLFGPGSQTALLSAKALQYDQFRQLWEKRLARYLSWQWRIKARNGQYARPYRVATLLDAIDRDLDTSRPAVTRDRLEKALDRLQRDEVIGGWHYDRWDEESARSRGWGQVWMVSTILIDPPATVVEQYRRFQAGAMPVAPLRDVSTLSAPAPAPAAGMPPPAPEDVDLGRRLKERRKLLSLSQEQIGPKLGVAQGQISKAERGKFPRGRTGAAFREHLLAWLAATEPPA